MAREENMLILKMLQEGTISAEQAAELLAAVDTSESKVTAPAPPAASVPPAPASVPVPPPPAAYLTTPVFPVPPVEPVEPVEFVPPVPPVPPVVPDFENDDDNETLARARAKIAAAREKVAGVQEKLSAAEEKLDQAKDSGQNPMEALADALKDVPGARSLADTFRGIDAKRIVNVAKRQAKRMARQVRSSIGDMHLDVTIADVVQGEPTLSAPREATASVPAGGTLRVKNTLGNIEAVGADVPEARVAGVLRVWAQDRTQAEALAEQVKIVVDNAPEGPTISIQHPPRLKRVELNLKVFVPTVAGGRLSLLSPSGDVSAKGIKGGTAVVLASQSGDIRASEIAGDVAAEAAAGDIAVEGILGTVSVSTASGDIQAIRLSGNSFKATTQSGDVSLSDATVPVVTIETVSGDASVKSVASRNLKVRAVSGDASVTDVDVSEETLVDTVSGSVHLVPKSPLRSGVLRLVTVSGDASLVLPEKADAVLEVTTKSGDISAHFRSGEGDKTVNASGMVSLSEQVGKGAGAHLALSTVSGDISVKQVMAEV